MWRTALACAAFVALAGASAARLTMGFEVWTAEGARRLEVVRSPLAVPQTTVAGPHTAPTPLPALLADGGGATILDFMYTRCLAVCSSLGSGFQQLQAQIARDVPAGTSPLRLLSVSFDPAHDDAAALERYAARLGADPRIWRFVAPAQARDLEALLDRFGVVVIPDGIGGYQHNAALLVVDARARVVRIFDYGELEEALGFARSLAGMSAAG